MPKWIKLVFGARVTSYHRGQLL